MEPGASRQVIGLVFHGFREELDRRGLTEEVLERLQGDARDALAHPPPHSSWWPAGLHDRIIEAIGAAANRKAVRDVLYMVSKKTTGPLALPLLKTFLGLFGVNPVSLLKNLNRITSLHMRGGLHFGYQPETDRSGVVTVTYDEPVDPIQFAVWEGVLLFGKDLFGLDIITVDTAVPLSDGRTAQIHVSW